MVSEAIPLVDDAYGLSLISAEMVALTPALTPALAEATAEPAAAA